MLTRSRFNFAILATLLAIGGLFVAGALTPSTVSADHDDDFDDYCYSGHGYNPHDPYYDDHDHDDDDDDHDHFDDDCHDIFGGHNDYAGFLSVVASPSAINCGSTTRITVDLGTYGYGYGGYHGGHHDDDDDYHGHGYGYGYGVTVALGVNVPGLVQPSTIVNTVDGRAVFTYTAPATYKGPVYITASTEYLTGSLNLQVNCNISQPSAPQIRSSAPVSSGGIRPPNTGDGGLKADGGSDWNLLLAVPALAAASGLVLASRRMSRAR